MPPINSPRPPFRRYSIPQRFLDFWHWPDLWRSILYALIAIFLSPIIAVIITAAQPDSNLWHHLATTVLPRYTANSLILTIGVMAATAAIGVPAAWFVTRYDFPARRTLEWMLLLPATVPAYIIAYTYTDFLDYAGPLQTLLRHYFNWNSRHDYWFPEIRSLGGAIFIMGAVFYPYVYLLARSAMSRVTAAMFETAALAQRDPFRHVALPLIRPAIVAGMALAGMETLGDFGTVDYFAIETLTLGIFNVWLGMGDLASAARLALLTVIFVVALLMLEKTMRARRGYHITDRQIRPAERLSVSRTQGFFYMILCLLPVIIGFFIPVAILARFVISGYSLDFNVAALAAARHSLLIAALVTLIVMAIGALMAIIAHYSDQPHLQRLSLAATSGYAFPGTILAIGVVMVGGAVDNSWAAFTDLWGLPPRSIAAGSVGLIVAACVARFLAIGHGAAASGMTAMPVNMMNACRSLGSHFGGGLCRVIIPLLSPSLLAGGLLVFVEVMKELPMTLLLRPFNFETLPTYVYQYAKDELLEEAALPALLIIAAGLLPMIVLNGILRRLTASSQRTP